ncbi:MAG: FGGY family carbohydrate kinase [Flaviflexus sp.]|nr:FGGY family carbohydrate kinase [Flaviflexus sp.]
MKTVLGFDVGTSSSKGVLTTLTGEVLASTQISHEVSRPAVGHVEMDATVWWDEFVTASATLLNDVPEAKVAAVGVSGMGPCVALTDEEDHPVRPAILYGVDTRAMAQVERLTDELGGPEAVLESCGSVLSSQAAGPKIAWVAETEPEIYARAARLYMPASFLVRKLTGAYVLDHQSASQATPLYDRTQRQWFAKRWQHIAPGIEPPALAWAEEIAGTITESAAALTGLPAGIPVVAGTIDAWAEALSVDAHNVGDLMLMYGTTMFFVNTVAAPLTSPSLWGTAGALRGTSNLAGGMATSGAITNWLRKLCAADDFGELVAEAADSGVGARGLLMLPYFAGERTPIMDPDARGLIAGLTLEHTRGDLYRAALEATGFAVRHNIETIEAAGGRIDRLVAVGGGTKGDVWTQIISDITGREQVIPTETIGASYGMAWLAARTLADIPGSQWNPPARIITPNPDHEDAYAQRYELFRSLYEATADHSHALAHAQRS